MNSPALPASGPTGVIADSATSMPNSTQPGTKIKAPPDPVPNRLLSSDDISCKDPLLACLALAAHVLERSVHAPSLAVGFATDDEGRIPLASYPELAAKHGLRATWSRVEVAAIPGYMLPVIVPMLDGRACVLLSIRAGQAAVLMPESGMQELAMPVTELAALAAGQVLVVKLAPKRTESQLTPFKGAAFSWFWGTLWRFKQFYIESMLATVVANLLTLATVFFTMNVYDRVIPTQAYTSLWTLTIGTVVAMLLEFLMRWFKAKLVDAGGKRADLLINATLLREIMSIRLEHRPQSIGVFASSMRDFDALRDFFSSASLVVLADLPFIVLFVVLIWIVGGPVALVPALVVPLLMIVGLLAQRPLMKSMRENMKESGDRQSVLMESLLNLETIKAHNGQGYLQRRWEQSNLAGAESYMKTRSVTNLIMTLTATAQQLVTVVMVVIGVYLIHANQLTLGGLIACVILAGRAIGPLGSVMGLAARYQQAASALETLDGLMKRPRDRSDERQYVVPETIRGAMTAEELEFAYPSEHKIPVIRRVSLDLAAGDRVALLGRIGSGKSTLLRLLAGLYQPLGGSLRVDGIDVQQMDPIELRNRIGYVSQDTQLFMGSLRENLVLADTWISDAQIVDVLQRLDLYHMVLGHPQGLDMGLTEAGGGLSGGQRQMLSIARLLLRNPSVVFLDEPTSHMDQNTESRVIQVLGEWLKGRTVLLSTHRPQLLAWVNRIMVMDKGRLVADGPRDEMIDKLSKGLSVPAAEHRHE